MNVGESWLSTAGGTFDRAVTAAIRLRNERNPSRVDSVPHEERMVSLRALRDAYGEPETRGIPDPFFVAPGPITPELHPVRTKRDIRVIDASWPSAFVPHLEDQRERYLRHEKNRTAHARLFLAPKPRPAVILVHGYLAGQYAFEERAWPIDWLTRHMDVALVVLPFHGLRARTDRRAPPPFPGADPRYSLEGFGQCIYDIRALAGWLRARGAPQVGAMGMSLGGYTTALLATVDPELAFAAPVIPLSSTAAFAFEQGRLGSGPQAEEQQAALEDAMRMVLPTARPSLLPKERVLVVGARGDRITPIAHAERLARHFDAPLVQFAGGHLLQFGRAEAFRTIGRWLRDLRLTEHTPPVS